MATTPSLYTRRVGDYLLVLLIIAACAAGTIAARPQTGAGAPQAVVYVDGVRRMSIPLTEARTAPEAFGPWHLTLETASGRIRVQASDCPKHNCVRQGWISRPAQTIVCLPARVLIRIEGARRANDVDAITE